VLSWKRIKRYSDPTGCLRIEAALSVIPLRIRLILDVVMANDKCQLRMSIMISGVEGQHIEPFSTRFFLISTVEVERLRLEMRVGISFYVLIMQLLMRPHELHAWNAGFSFSRQITILVPKLGSLMSISWLLLYRCIDGQIAVSR
jgi:hypothetical protein